MPDSGLKSLRWGTIFWLVFFSTQAGWSRADSAAGAQFFEANDCASCHLTTGPVEPMPVTQRPGIKGPPLWFAGNKFKQGWLATWLEHPTPIRRVLFGTVEHGVNEHVALASSSAQDVAEYLMTLTDAAVKPGQVEPVKLNRRKMFQAEKLFTKKQVCFGCHEFRSRQGEIGGFTGPSLLGSEQRLNENWVFAFFNDPIRYYPNGRMPVYGDQAFDPFTEAELKLLIQYITNM